MGQNEQKKMFLTGLKSTTLLKLNRLASITIQLCREQVSALPGRDNRSSDDRG